MPQPKAIRHWQIAIATVRLDDAYCASSLVFEGVPVSSDTVMAVETGTRYPKNPIAHVDIRFKVERTLKVTGEKIAIISTPFVANECAYRFIPGVRYLVFARKDKGLLVTDRCTPTRTMDTIGQGFTDSLEFIRSGHRWIGGVPLELPCK